MATHPPAIAEKTDTCKNCHKQIWYSNFAVHHNIEWYHTHNNNAFCTRYFVEGPRAEPDEQEDLPLGVTDE